MNSFMYVNRKSWHFLSSSVACQWPSAICPRTQSLEYFPKIVPLRNIMAAPNPHADQVPHCETHCGGQEQGIQTLLCLPCASLHPRVYPTTSGVLSLVLELLHMWKSYSTELQPFTYKLSRKCDIHSKNLQSKLKGKLIYFPSSFLKSWIIKCAAFIAA